MPCPDEAVVRNLVEQALAGVLDRPVGSDAGRAPGEPAASVPGRIPDSPELGGRQTASPAGGASEASADARTVALGADHGGVGLKDVLVRHLVGRGYGVTDCGTTGTDPVDYPDVAHVVARLVASGACAVGVLVDGAGIGSAMAANKVPGVRAANAHDTSMARNAREHNHANVLTLGARMIGEGLAQEVVDTFLATPWGGERHARRVAKLAAIEQHYRTRQAEEPAR